MTTDHFPQGIAQGESFIGRDKETQSLIYNVNQGHHTLLVAPRRFGKTSLARHVLAKLKLPHAEANFFLAKTEQAVQSKIIRAVETILSQVEPQQGNLLTKVARFFTASKKRWTFGLKGLASIEITPSKEEDTSDTLFTALSLAEELLNNANKKAVLYFDEIQQLHSLKDGFTLQAAIREFAQMSKHIVFIFSGSNRRILHNMFDDKAMPLYELCERIRLDRISEENYSTYINDVAVKSLGKPLKSTDMATLLGHTERHPKRTYNLCYQLWKHAKGSINEQLINESWDEFVDSRLTDVRLHLSQLNTSQLKLLTLIALGTDEPLTGKRAQERLNLTSPSIVEAKQHLLANDYIEETTNARHQVIDPLIREVLVRHESGNVLTQNL